MKKILIIIFVAIIFVPQLATAQCKEFAETKGLELLNTNKFVHDGRFNAIRLRSGDDIRLFKSFYAGEKYRMVIIADDGLGEVKFEVSDFKGKQVIHTSSKGKPGVWDFNPEISQRLVISVSVPAGDVNAEKTRGCVVILFGVAKGQ